MVSDPVRSNQKRGSGSVLGTPEDEYHLEGCKTIRQDVIQDELTSCYCKVTDLGYTFNLLKGRLDGENKGCTIKKDEVILESINTCHPPVRNAMEELENWEDEEPFGETAIKLGFCTAKDVREALNKQHKLRTEEGEEVMIGVIMMEEGFLTSEQVISILRSLKHRNGSETAS